MSHAFRCGDRGSGRTTRMIQALTPEVRFIVVHTRAMGDHIERLLWEHRRDLIHNSVRRPHVLVVQSTRDIERLRGCVFAVDHAVWDTEMLSAEARDLLRALCRQPPPLGVVDATIDRDAGGAITSVTLPGKGWS